MIVNFDVLNAVATELNGIAVKAGYPNASAREKVLRDAVPQVNTSDVIIS